MKTAILLAAATMFAVANVSTSFAATPMTDAGCEAMFVKIDINQDGSLIGEEAAKVIEKMTRTDVQPADASVVTKADFLSECMKNKFDGM